MDVERKRSQGCGRLQRRLSDMKETQIVFRFFMCTECSLQRHRRGMSLRNVIEECHRGMSLRNVIGHSMNAVTDIPSVHSSQPAGAESVRLSSQVE